MSVCQAGQDQLDEYFRGVEALKRGSECKELHWIIGFLLVIGDDKERMVPAHLSSPPILDHIDQDSNPLFHTPIGNEPTLLFRQEVRVPREDVAQAFGKHPRSNLTQLRQDCDGAHLVSFRGKGAIGLHFGDQRDPPFL
jgi:hypothetical protein